MKILKKMILAMVLTALYVNTWGNEKMPDVYNIRSMSLELASKAAWGAINSCRKKGYSVAVSIVDRGGNEQVQLRDRFAGPHTPETAFRKAWTANSFRQSTGVLAMMLQEKKIPDQVVNNPGVLLVSGGQLIQTSGQLIGAIGVSGAPPGANERDSIDGACATAGIEIIREALEFSD